jgi:hypothetical protein
VSDEKHSPEFLEAVTRVPAEDVRKADSSLSTL